MAGEFDSGTDTCDCLWLCYIASSWELAMAKKKNAVTDSI